MIARRPRWPVAAPAACSKLGPLFVMGDMDTNNNTERYSTTDQTATAIRDRAVVSGGDINALIAAR